MPTTAKPTSELELMANRAWVAMNRKLSILATITGEAGPMPAALAVDMVQDVAPNRATAIRAIQQVAADDAWALAPTQPAPWNPATDDRAHIVACIINRMFDSVDGLLGGIRARCAFPIPDAEGLAVWHDWQLWERKVRGIVALCRELDALWPAGEKATC